MRSGGHSWSGSHLRDGTVLIDLSNLRHVAVDREAMTGTAQPGIKGSELNAMLAEQNLFFPTGHCTGVSIGGYLLQGGFGWAGRDYGFTQDATHTLESENASFLYQARDGGFRFLGRYDQAR